MFEADQRFSITLVRCSFKFAQMFLSRCLQRSCVCVMPVGALIYPLCFFEKFCILNVTNNVFCLHSIIIIRLTYL